MARDSGLSVSALRFYDGAGVLVPAWVDPVSGYRWYGPEQLEESRLPARLRRALSLRLPASRARSAGGACRGRGGGMGWTCGDRGRWASRRWEAPGNHRTGV
jgi:hypothetical protein